MDTDRLIQELSNDVPPVTPLAGPSRRMLAWAAGAAVYIALMVLVMTPREDLGARMGDPWFMFEQVAALGTGLSAAVAAFATSVPGRRREIVWLPLIAAVVWIALVGAGAVRDMRLAAAGAAMFEMDWGCVGTVLAGAVVPAAMMAAMLRRGLTITPHVTAALGGLAAAGLGNLAGCLSHPDSSNLIVLVWHVGTVLAVAGLAGMAGAQLLRWPLPRGAAQAM